MTTAAERIAVIGMGCRFPKAPDPDSYWMLIKEGRSAVSEVPLSRWDLDLLYSPTPRTPGKINTRWAAFLDDVYGFDAKFFRTMPIEASRIDPQQRLVLEVAWEALENAGIDATQLSGSLTGVYVGVSHSDHDRLLYRDLTRVDGYNGPNTYHTFAANRLSYFLKLRGPSLAIDGACSSSLAAIHLACQALRAHDCDLAIAGGVNLNLTPDEFIALSWLGVLSAGDTGRPFAEGSDGYVRGEGCGMVVLKRLDDARRDGDNVLAVIRGSSLNHNGLSNGITAPSASAQEEVMRRALMVSGVEAESVTFIEAMGTGTNLGDPMEIAALKAVYGQPGSASCSVGSVKANIGHLEAASGVSSLIKVLLAMQHETIPPQPNLERINPRITLDGSRLAFPLVSIPWSGGASPRTAAVSAFGFGGANAHLIVEDWPLSEDRPTEDDRDVHVLTLSAQTGPALRLLVERYERLFASPESINVGDVCYTTNVGRSHWQHRLAILARTKSDARELLGSFLEKGLTTGTVLTPRDQFTQSKTEVEVAAAQRLDMLRSMAERYARGETLDWSSFHTGEARRRIPLPTYPFQREEHRLAVPERL